MSENTKRIYDENGTCPAIGYQAVTVSVPVSVKPFAHAGTTETECCGRPIVTSGVQTATGIKNGSCNFTISQNIVVAIPVEFGAEATVGETYVDCIEASADEIDCNALTQGIEE